MTFACTEKCVGGVNGADGEAEISTREAHDGGIAAFFLLEGTLE